MYYIADLHVHSCYSRATSRTLNLEALYQWGAIKGIHVMGTGDFTHPKWFQELQDKLIPDRNGFYKLKNPPPALMHSQAIETRFCLSTEVSCIYKEGDKLYKNHNLLYAPDFETAAKLNAKLASSGNLTADGRPILGLSARNLLEIIIETSERAYLIPAHVWTPWFSALGSKAGYDSIAQCFKELTPYIFALETGLSSDPAMNRRVSALDKYAMVSNSDAHSAQNLGREANIFNTAFTYDGLFDALKTQQGFIGTLEFFPQEGKYYMDGHRKCGICLDPTISLTKQRICPQCGTPLTIGVLHRVMELADREQSIVPTHTAGFEYIIPLPEIIAEITGTGVSSKTVQKQFAHMIGVFGNEFNCLLESPLADIKQKIGPIYAEAITRLRNRQVISYPGYDGVYGIIRLFQPGELKQLQG